MKNEMDKALKQVTDFLTPAYRTAREALDKQFEPPPSVGRLEAHLANQINATREQTGLQRLAFNRELAAVARAHSAEMCGLNYFEHESPTPGLRTPSERYQLGFGQQAAYVSENIFHSSSNGWQKLSLVMADQAHSGLMSSPGHRANILSEEPTQMGVGIVANDKGDIWVTQMFSRP